MINPMFGPNAIAVQFKPASAIRFQFVRSAQMLIPPTAQAQSIGVFASVNEAGPFLQLHDEQDRPITLKAVPGKLMAVPESVCGCLFVMLQAEQNKDFVANLVVKTIV